MSDIAVVMNRRARRLVERSRVYRAIVDGAKTAQIFETFSVAEQDALASRLTEARVVVYAGGDGTYTAGLSSLTNACRATSRELPALAFLPAGTVTTVARNFGFRGDAAQYAKHLLGALAAGKSHEVERPTLLVKSDDSADRVGFMFGAGLVSKFFEHYDRAILRGYVGAGLAAARIFAGSFVRSTFAERVLARVRASLRIDDRESINGDFSLLFASVLRDAGLHLIVTPRAGEEPEKLAFVASRLEARELAPQLFRVLGGQGIRGPDEVDRLVKTAELSFPEQTPCVLDGETFRTKHVHIATGPLIRTLGLTML